MAAGPRDLEAGLRSAVARDRRPSVHSGDCVERRNAGADDGQSIGSCAVHRRTTRSNNGIVADGSISRLAKLAADLLPSASPRWWSMRSSRAVRHDRVGRTSSPN